MPAIFSSSRIVPVARSIRGWSRSRSRRPARARVGRERGPQVLWPRCARLHDLAVLESQLDPVIDVRRTRWDREADRAVGRALVRAGEDLAAGHVAPAVGVDPRAAVDAQAQVGALGLDPDLPRRGQPPTSRSWTSVSSRHACTGRAGRGTAPASRTPRSRRRSSPPAAPAAAVGHSVPHQRPASALLQRRAGPGDPGHPAPGRRRRALGVGRGGRCVSERVTICASVRSSGAKPSGRPLAWR